MIGIARPLTAWVGSVLGDGIMTRWGELGKLSDAAMVKAAPGDPLVRAYLGGGGMYRFSYEVYLRVTPRNSSQRISGMERLEALADAIRAGGRPDCEGITWAGHVPTQQPALIETQSDGAELYQLTAQLSWIERS